MAGGMDLLVGPGGEEGLGGMEGGAGRQVDLIAGGEIEGVIGGGEERNGPGGEVLFGRGEPLVQGLGRCGCQGGINGRGDGAMVRRPVNGRRVVEIGGVEDEGGAKAQHCRGAGVVLFRGALTVAGLVVEGDEQGPVDEAAVAALAGLPALALCLLEADPEGEIGAAQGEVQFQECGIAALVGPAGEEVAVLAAALGVPGLAPGIDALLHQGDELMAEALISTLAVVGRAAALGVAVVEGGGQLLGLQVSSGCRWDGWDGGGGRSHGCVEIGRTAKAPGEGTGLLLDPWRGMA